MNNFEVISISPMSDCEHPREIAKRVVAKHRRAKQAPALLPGRTSLPGGQEAPPVGSFRRVIWTASIGHKRSRIERIKSAIHGTLQKVVGC